MRFLTLLLLTLLCASAADSDLAGQFTGEWKSNGSGTGGTFRMNLAAAGGAWKCEVSFTFADAEIKTKNCAAKVEQGKLEASYEYDVAGNVLRSKIVGQWSEGKFAGQYHATTVDGGAAVDEGTWTAARAK